MMRRWAAMGSDSSNKGYRRCLMVRVSGLDVTESHDEAYHSTKADDRQSGLAGIQLLSFNQLQLFGEKGDPHSLRGAHLPLDCETHQTVSHHPRIAVQGRSEEHTSELQSPCNLVCRLLLEKKKK